MGTEHGECSISSFAVFTMIFIFKYNSTDRLTLSSFPTRETKHQIGMALCGVALAMLASQCTSAGGSKFD